ncbi:hypothetical protein [Stenotrophomonas indicatrix]|uniref:hypothetical protein n=1 Tax=Stenotrophomonas indicatrix TaxID=2045451 RepID=UPI00200506F3|nr:hypothetical protein [Stenotrophomonas indicatrix]MCK6230527.1 hypothetical protein [Stenotrophomonas indicatrix]
MMIVPAYWAEARLQDRYKGRPLVVRRFGWSDDDQDAAQAHADARAREALDAILSGQAVPRRERRTNYGVEGIPIREQIVQRSDDVIVTRNSYGALCLNTPDVLFADIDHVSTPSGCALPLLGALGLLAAGALIGGALGNFNVGLAAGGIAMVVVNQILSGRRNRRLARSGGVEGIALQRVQAFVEHHPDWHLRAYRTPAGLRILAMHATFEPQDAQVHAFFKALGTDTLYARMCTLQHCFRARLTPKPWRLGIIAHIRPPVAAWSAEQASNPDRLAWVAEYERESAGFAACAYVRSFGDERRVHAKAERVRDLHDRMSRALENLPLG